VLFLSVAAKFNHEQLSGVYQWFSKHLRVIEADRDEGFFLYTANRALTSQLFSTKLGELLRFADLGIADFSVEKSQSLPDDMPEEIRQLITSGRVKWSGQFNVQLRHQVSGNAELGIPLSLHDESKGTQRLFSIGGPWIDVLQHGYTLVVDELGASLHPLLARELVSMFHSSDLNPRNAQLVFDTHDTTLLDSSIFRRDQVWFVEKDNGSVSHLYPLLDFSPRKEEALGKGYLRGRYGAIPILGDLAGFGAEAADGKD
jgi:AAA15 family ATPase/GTPase